MENPLIRFNKRELQIAIEIEKLQKHNQLQMAFRRRKKRMRNGGEISRSWRNERRKEIKNQLKSVCSEIER